MNINRIPSLADTAAGDTAGGVPTRRALISRGSLRAIGALTALLALGAPAFAQHGGGGGGHGGGGGGHSFGGGGHGGGFGGGHAGGFAGGHAGFAGGHAYGYSGGHAVAGGYGGGHYAPRVGGYAGLRGGYASGHAAAISSYRGYQGGSAGHSAYYGGHTAGYGERGFREHGGWHGYGWGRGGYGWHRPYWGGGYWHGGYWPRAYYGWGYPWFLGVLPAVYATYWWGGIPYYYANDVYYTWSPDYSGYVVTDPPPADGSETASSGDGGYESADVGPSDNAGSPGSVGSAEVYAYPKEGQSDQQQSTDRYECHRWAVAQSGFDPTRTSAPTGNSADYRRAMAACLNGRGYSAK